MPMYQPKFVPLSKAVLRIAATNVSYCLRMLSECVTQLTQTSLYVVQIQVKVVLI